eukprot:6669497-Prymnesium_polylepis.1
MCRPPPNASRVVCKSSHDAILISEPKLRVVAIPQAGMGAQVFFGWQKVLPHDVEVLPVELPGRNSRSREPKP